MSRMASGRFFLCLMVLGLPMLGLAVPAIGLPQSFERAETDEPCADYSPLRKPLFGDLHVHTSYSFDSYVASQRNDPWGAYRYGKGEAITLPDADGDQTVRAQLQRPLDFMAVTDHSEFLGPMGVCTQDPGKLGYWHPACMLTRASNLYLAIAANAYWVTIGLANTGSDRSETSACAWSDCKQAGLGMWQNIQRAAADNNDHCAFTTFVAYEYTDMPGYKNMHRNVIFRNEQVIERPITAYDTGDYNFPGLWQGLREQCLEGTPGCDVMTIPHNSNLSGGLMFPDPRTPEEARDRLAFEPVVELVQHKGASECRFDRLAGRGLATSDELCDFEQIKSDDMSMMSSIDGHNLAGSKAFTALDQFAERNMVRNALKAGVSYQQKNGINPFKMGFIGSTDTHSAAPGGVEEDNYVGHLARRDAGYRNIQDGFAANPGGLAVVWAEENSRDAVFDGIRRKETYATSGTRPTVRFFGGWELPPDLCQSPDMVARAYRQGVPMGGELPPARAGAPRFLVAAAKDPGSPGHPGTDLQRIQIIKGWSDAQGISHEQVFEVAGNPDNGAGVDPRSCRPVGAGAANLCQVWTDPTFDAGQNAFYYARVVENPTCRWSTLQCKALGVDPFSPDCVAQAASADVGEDVLGNCCLDASKEPFYSPTIQERAWTSPIWYSAK